MQNSKPILLVEDDNVDAIAVKRALQELEILNELVHVTNGEEALEYLKDQSREKPGIVLLDLDMPKMNGIEFLEVVKNDEALRKIPVVVLTTSMKEQEVVKSFDFCVAGYMFKSADYEKFVETIRTIDQYWRLNESLISG